MLTSQDKAPLYNELIYDCNVPKRLLKCDKMQNDIYHFFLKGLETKLN